MDSRNKKSNLFFLIFLLDLETNVPTMKNKKWLMKRDEAKLIMIA